MPTIRIACCALLLTALHALDGGIGSITLVDGRTTPAEILFQHPAAPLLIVRSTAHRSIQSLPLALVHAIAIGGAITTLSSKRELTPAETLTLQRDGLWGDDVGTGQIGRYATQVWEPRPALVWAKPGVTGNGTQAGNWLDERGQPVVELAWNGGAGGKPAPFDGDVLAPQADTPYELLQPGNRDKLPSYTLRHLTVERNANYKLHYHISGNLWVKDGAALGQGTQVGGFGSGDAGRHTVMRFCNWHDLPYEPKWPYAGDISHWVRIDTGEQGSLEVVGLTGGPSDRITLSRGTLVISEDAFLGCGNRAAFNTAPGTTLILLDGAHLACPSPLKGGSGGKIIGTLGFGGTVMVGTPERPITRDFDMGVAYYPLEGRDAAGKADSRASGGSLVLGDQGRIVVHSADPRRARLVIRPRPRESMPTSSAKGTRRNGKRVAHANDKYLPAPPEFWDNQELPKGIIAILRGRTDFDGVVLDGFYEGGIVVAPEARQAWRNVTLGPGNLAAGEAIFRAP